MNLERSTDYGLIRSIMIHPKIYDCISDDGSPERERFQPIESDQLIYLVVFDDEPLGLFLLVPQNAACVEIHTCLLPMSWGTRARIAGAQALEWIWNRTAFQRIVTSVPVYNRLAFRFAQHCGLQEFGMNPKSYLKKGVLHDQVLMGVSKES